MPSLHAPTEKRFGDVRSTTTRSPFSSSKARSVPPLPSKSADAIAAGRVSLVSSQVRYVGRAAVLKLGTKNNTDPPKIVISRIRCFIRVLCGRQHAVNNRSQSPTATAMCRRSAPAVPKWSSRRRRLQRGATESRYVPGCRSAPWCAFRLPWE